MNTNGEAIALLPFEAAVEQLITMRNESLAKSPLPSFYPKNAIRIPEARISSRLCDLVDTELNSAREKQTTRADIFIVGNDGAYFDVDEVGESKWERSIAQWINSGAAKVSYLLLSAPQPLKRKLSELKQSVEEPEFLDFYFLNRERTDLPSSVRTLADRWKTYHFVIGDSPKFLWLEGNHPPKSKIAYDCAYLNKSVCESSPDWAICKSSVEAVKPFLNHLLD